MADAESEVRDLTFDKSGGILLKTIRAGEGEEGPRIGDRVFVHYTGRLQDGTVFDSSKDRGEEPFQLTLGKAEVIKGWDCAIANMRKGEVAVITCSPEHAYGKKGLPPSIPPNATVIYEVELIDWKGVDLTTDKDGGVIKRMIKQGERIATPNDGATVTIRYTGYYKGKDFETKTVTFTQGEGDQVGLIPGLEMAARKMKQGEQDRLTIAPRYAFGEKGCPKLNIPSNAALVYEVEMVIFEKARESWEMDVGQKIQQSKIIKDKGTKYFLKGDHRRALSYYKKIVSFLEHETSGLQGEEPLEREKLLQAAHLNIAMCSLKLNNFCDAEAACNIVLETEPQNVKAIFRRGQSRLERCDYGPAAGDFAQVLELEPSNKAAKNQLAVSRQRQEQALNKEKELYTNMFQKMADKSGGGFSLYQTMPEVGEWNNEMAKNMMPLQEERDAFEDIVETDKKDFLGMGSHMSD
ncbi:peptidyl-prolyl cis-trans isomerase FKBP4-like [Littorina saxatilis]|uniref:peptidylprolyl isomerase n=1 Tax=Littorina saxatilis TaxID=31220 RepID=A0AAN9GA19_9CAEN